MMYKSNEPESIEDLHTRYNKFANGVIISFAIFFIAGLVSIIMLVAISNQIKDTAKIAKKASNKSIELAIEQKVGRRLSTNFTCGAIESVIVSGRKIILGDGKISPLEAVIYKQYNISISDVLKNRKRLSIRYTDEIVHSIEKSTGTKGIVLPNGRLNCDKLQKDSNTK
jgi:competence protein ComGC